MSYLEVSDKRNSLLGGKELSQRLQNDSERDCQLVCKLLGARKLVEELRGERGGGGREDEGTGTRRGTGTEREERRKRFGRAGED
eukprot:745738-Hanusia_phi.AAC.1